MTETLGFRQPEHTARHEPEQLDDDMNKLTRGYLRGRADRIAKMVGEPGSKHEAYKQAHQKFVEQEEDPQLQKFAKLLLLAPMVSRLHGRLGEIRTEEKQARRHNQHLSRKAETERRQVLRTNCAYNQLWGDFLAQNQDEIPPQQAADWLERASGSDSGWARRIVSGVTVEIAASKVVRTAAQQLEEESPHLRFDVRPGDVEEDLRGGDLVLTDSAGQEQYIDVKTGKHRPTLPVSRHERNNNLQLSINPAHLKPGTYEVDERYTPGYIEELTTALTK
jgi:hypothetical protein